MKKFLIAIMLFMTASPCYTQDRTEFLQTEIGEITPAKIKLMVYHGLISESEKPVMAIEMVKMMREDIVSEATTYGEFMEIYKKRKAEQDKLIAKTNSFGRDTVYLRAPDGGYKLCIGTGKKSLEKLVLRECKKRLPKKYPVADYNLMISLENINVYAGIVSSVGLYDIWKGALAGSAMSIMAEYGIDLSRYRIGDMVEIGKRVKESREFKPFLKVLDYNGINYMLSR